MPHAAVHTSLGSNTAPHMLLAWRTRRRARAGVASAEGTFLSRSGGLRAKTLRVRRVCARPAVNYVMCG